MTLMQYGDRVSESGPAYANKVLSLADSAKHRMEIGSQWSFSRCSLNE